jgi:hypothetical protein
MWRLIQRVMCGALIFLWFGNTTSIAVDATQDDSSLVLLELLDRASNDIRQMEASELEVFLNYLSSCSKALSRKDMQARCGIANSAYRIKYARGRALDQLMSALVSTEREMDMDELSNKPLNLSLSVRHTYARDRLDYVAGDRFRALKK